MAMLKVQTVKGGKKYREKKKLVDKPSYSLAEAVALLTKVGVTTFDASAEVHIRIAADMTQSDQLVRGTVTLPHGTGKKVRIVAFVTDDLVDDAKKAGVIFPALTVDSKPGLTIQVGQITGEKNKVKKDTKTQQSRN